MSEGGNVTQVFVDTLPRSTVQPSISLDYAAFSNSLGCSDCVMYTGNCNGAVDSCKQTPSLVVLSVNPSAHACQQMPQDADGWAKLGARLHKPNAIEVTNYNLAQYDISELALHVVDSSPELKIGTTQATWTN